MMCTDAANTTNNNSNNNDTFYTESDFQGAQRQFTEVKMIKTACMTRAGCQKKSTLLDTHNVNRKSNLLTTTKSN